MNVTRVTLTDEQKVAAVDRAIALMREGESQSAATRRAAEEFGTSSPSVRRYAIRQGRPLADITTEETKKRTERAAVVAKVYGLAEQREIAMLLVTAIELRARTLLTQAGDENAPPDLDLRLQRATVALREATELEHTLAMRGATPRPGEDVPEAPEATGERPANVSSLDESRALLAEMERVSGD